ncbi:MAG: hypothetical protein ABIK96_00480 [bacterium]
MNERMTTAVRHFLRLQKEGHYPPAAEVVEHAVGVGVRPDVLLVIVHGHMQGLVLPSRVRRDDTEMLEAIDVATRSGEFAHAVQLY